MSKTVKMTVHIMGTGIDEVRSIIVPYYTTQWRVTTSGQFSPPYLRSLGWLSDVTFMCVRAGYDIIHDVCGITNLFYVDEYAGCTVTFPNGAYFIIANDISTIEYYNPQGGRILYTTTSWGSAQSGVGWTIATFPGMYGSSRDFIIAEHSRMSCNYNGMIIIGHTYYYPDTSLINNPRVFYVNYTPPSETDDPYKPGGESQGDVGGGGTFSWTSDSIAVPDAPDLEATEAGFITLFAPTQAQLNSLSTYMWDNNLFDVDTWKKLFANPMDAILGLSIVPCSIGGGGAKTVKVGNISTGISMNTAGSQYVTVDCGSVSVSEYWGAYLDYEPYTTADLYLPYIGTEKISIDDIMGKTVSIKYRIDILSGACCAYISSGGSVLYTFIGQCSCPIPIASSDFTNVVNGALSAAKSVIGGAVSGGGVGAVAGTALSVASNVMSSKPNVQRSGSIAGTGGFMGIQTPYFIFSRPKQAIPGKQNALQGYPSFVTKTLSDVSGYTEIESVHLDNVVATQGELDEIEMILKGGVIL